MTKELKNHIEKLPDGKYRLLSHTGKNLGTFDTHDEAAKHEGEVEYFKEHKNAKDFPKTYYARHMEPGLCGYETEKILVDADAMKNMCASFQNKPVYVGHQRVDVSKIQEQADGYVTECFYNELDGWLWAKMIIVSDKGKEAIDNGWSVSNAYVPTEFASGGQHHSVDFDRKIVNAIFTHLAIVSDPRYEGAKIFTLDEYKNYCATKRAQLEELKNSKGDMRMFKRIFNREEKEVTTVDALNDGSVLELQNGKTVTLKEMAEAYLNAKAKKNAEGGAEEKKGDEKQKLNGDTEVDVGGEKMPLAHLMNKYMNVQKENEAAEEEKKKKESDEKKNAEDKDAEEKKNAADKVKSEDEKANAKHFEELKNAKAKTPFVQVDTAMDQLARGQAQYGSAK